MFAKQNAQWLNGQIMFDQTSAKASPYIAVCVLPLQIATLTSCDFIGIPFRENAIQLYGKIKSSNTVLDENV